MTRLDFGLCAFILILLLLYSLLIRGNWWDSTQSEEGANGGGGGRVAEIYVAVIYPKSKETFFSRVIKQTVTSLSEDFTTATNLRIVPYYTAISDTEGYSVEEVKQACTEWNHKPIIAAVVFSSFKSGFGHVLTSLHNNIPVLWATGELQPGYFERVPLSRFEVRLDPGSFEVLRSLRSLLLATHWHAFTVMHTTSLLASRAYKDIINQPPLLPTIIQFRPDSTSYYIFRLLSDVSKSTKGVIVLICEASDAKRVIQESKKLNMVNGDFVWLWIDTSAMLLNDRSIRLEKMREPSYVVEMRKVRHAPNLRANETKISPASGAAAAAVAAAIKPPRFRDNNSSNNATASSTTVFCSTTNHSDLHENKTDLRFYANDNIDNNYVDSNNVLRYTNTNQGAPVLPASSSRSSSSSSEAPLNTLMKHHFSMLYRKKSWRINKEGKLQREKGKRNNAALAAAAPSSNKSSIRAESGVHGGAASKGNATLFLSVINAEATNYSGLISDSGKSDVRVNNVRRRRTDGRVASPSTSGERGGDVKYSTLSASIKDTATATTTTTTTTSDARVLPLQQLQHLAEKEKEKDAAATAAAADIDYNDAVRFMRNRRDSDRHRREEEFVDGFEVPVFADVSEPSIKNRTVPEMPVGILSVQLVPAKVDKKYVESTLKLLVGSVKDLIVKYGDAKQAKLLDLPRISCFDFFPVVHDPTNSVMEELTHNLKRTVREALAGRAKFNETHAEESWNSSLAAKFKILNLVPEENIVHNKSGIYLNKIRKVNSTALESRKWRTIGTMVGEENVHLETIVWPGGDIIPVSTGRGSRSIFRIVTAFAPPFVMIGELDEDGQCLRGIACHQFLTSDKDNLTLLFNEMERTEEEDEVNVLDRIQLEKSKDFWDGGIDDIRNHHFGHKFKTNCCYGLSMDLLENVAEELEFDFQLYIVADGLFGSKTMAGENSESKWNGIVGDLVSGAAHMSFSALSVSSSRAQTIDFSVPYFFSGVSFLAAPKESTDIPLLAFLLPFSPNLWIAIFTSLHVAAVAVAIYEWLSPFGLNPWGRQRSKNFGLASALWVMWGLLCGHLVQFKAPKSWPNKFLINVWGGFSVIFVASYTANIAALIAGLFFHTAVGDHHDRSLLTQRVGAPKASAAEYYVRSTNQMLWDHMQRYSVISVAEGVQLLKNGSLDILIADTPILDYYRATDHGCKLQKIGDTINEDTYAVGMMKGFPLKDSISAVIAKYATNGYMDILQEKWYGGLPCFKLVTDMAQPRPLGVAAVAGVFLMLGLGVVIGCLILLSEHVFYKYTLPSLRKKPKTSIWKSRNVMFFSQKLYRFINCVELVSPHHAARELVHTLRQGQITSLFQKSVRKKEHEQRQRQQKSKAQFFEMIQEIRRVQQEGRKSAGGLDGRYSPRKKYSHKGSQLLLSPTGLLKHRHRLSPGRLDFARRFSKDVFRSKSSGNLAMARMGSDISVATGRFIDYYGAQAIGRRLSHGTTADNSPPDINSRRHSQFLREDYLCLQPSPSSSDLQPDEMETKPIAASPSDTSIAACSKSTSPPDTTSPPPLTLASRRASASIFSRDIGPVAARKFSNVDSASFRGIKAKLQNKLCAPKLTLNNEDFLSCEGGSCNEHATKPFESSFERTNSVKSTEHVIEILIPSSDSVLEDESTTTMTTDAHSPNAVVASRRQSTALSECDQTNYGEAFCSADAQTADESKPKIILHLPKKKTRSASSSKTSEQQQTTPLSRLSADELKLLSQLSEKDLKDSLLKALAEKNPT